MTTAIGAPQGAEWLWILAIVVVLFGARKLPDIGRGLGEGIKEFRSAAKKASEDDDKDEPKKPSDT